MLIVKFRPYNEYTLHSLINQSLYFSTVFEFNNFNEYCLRPINDCPGNGQMEDFVYERLKQVLADDNFSRNLRQLAKINRTDFLINNVDAWLKNPQKISSDLLSICAECLAYHHVGIFCASKLDVFNKNELFNLATPATLMLAHYADNLSGLALIYEIENNNKLADVQYDLKGGSGSVLCLEILEQYMSGDFRNNSINEAFLRKTAAWKYESELRLFDKPGLKKAEDHNITLKACIYTPMLRKDRIESLEKINQSIYNDELQLIEIIPDIAHAGGFKARDNTCQQVDENYLKNRLNSN